MTEGARRGDFPITCQRRGQAASSRSWEIASRRVRSALWTLLLMVPTGTPRTDAAEVAVRSAK
jgi:hypothetical protein